MKGLVVHADHTLTIETLPMPQITDWQALVRMRSCGVCAGTDGKLIHGTFKNFDTYPAVLGHEGVGEVIEAGANAAYRVGDRVLLPFQEGMAGAYHSGWGAFAEYAVVGGDAACAQTILRPDDRVDDVEAAMVITFREVLSAMRRFGMEANRDIVVFGAGPVGLSFVRFARLTGMRTVIAVDITDEKARAARAMGADLAINSAAEDAAARIRALLPDGAHYVVDAVGVSSIINQAMGLLRDHGRICCYGISANLDMQLSWRDAPYNWGLDFVQWPSKAEEGEAHAQVMAWINCGALAPRDFISDVFPFERVLDAFALVEARRPGTKKIVVTF